ncbi:hypothetical protein HCJ57_03590 [Listeria booriae]|uniref:hypothetical protein n=1 Tax=Listeria booriae TaxID=1552123 RepID=UPI001628874D|nr:hypothetical protein [Listeria booriae]MBC2055568.1 hypothetical protein [Listeria booriae]
MNVQQFKSKFCQWSHTQYPKSRHSKFKDSLNKVLNNFDTINANSQIMIRDLTNSENLNINYFSKEIIVSPNIKRDCLYIGTIMPSWDRGLEKYCYDDEIYGDISWFFHFSSQYVARSRIINSIAAINIIYGRNIDFVGNTLIKTLKPSDSALKDNLITEFEKKNKINKSYKYGSREFNLIFWIESINALDPFINRIFFNYMRACKLFESGFSEEAITSLDKTLDVVQQYARERMGINENSIVCQRDFTLTALGVKRWEVESLLQLYKLRNYFGAHPSPSKWWDFNDVSSEEEIEVIFEIIKKVILKITLHEKQHRIVEKEPNSWTQWFNKNAMMLWDSVWWEKIQKEID